MDGWVTTMDGINGEKKSEMNRYWSKEGGRKGGRL